MESSFFLRLCVCTLVVLLRCCVAVPGTTSTAKSLESIQKTNERNNTIVVIISRGPLPNRRSKFPIIPPRLQLKTTTTATKTTEETTTMAITAEPTTEEIPPTMSPSNDTSRKQADIFEISSSDNSPSIAWPVPRRPASRRLWSSVSPAPVQSTPRPVPKLLLPRPTRPAMYSLDGFVPKPSMIRITTTEAPPHIKARYSNLVSAKTSKRKWYGRQSLDEEEEGDYRPTKRTQSSRGKSVSRYTAFKRKGVPGEDYPVYTSIPLTSFDCASKPGPGMYADPEAGCQIWHMCPGNAPHRYSFMCPNGTIFNEMRGVCDWWYNVVCVNLEEPVLRRRSGRSVPDTDDEDDILWDLQRI